MKIRTLFASLLACAVQATFADSLQPKDDETRIYAQPEAPLVLKPGDAHPSVKGWKFLRHTSFWTVIQKESSPRDLWSIVACI